MADSRENYPMRLKIDQLLSQGWSLNGRDPVRLQRGNQIKIVQGKALIDG